MAGGDSEVTAGHGQYRFVAPSQVEVRQVPIAIGMSNWQTHVLCTRLIRQHPSWSDEQVLEAARLHALEINVVQEARREVEGEELQSEVRSQRSYLQAGP